MLPVYRFWSGKAHFYTIEEAEKNKLINEYSDIWTPEGIAFYAFPKGEPPECKAVYRFWNAGNSTHFFTISEKRRTSSSPGTRTCTPTKESRSTPIRSDRVGTRKLRPAR